MTNTNEPKDILEQLEKQIGQEQEKNPIEDAADLNQTFFTEDDHTESESSENIEEAFLALIQSADDFSNTTEVNQEVFEELDNTVSPEIQNQQISEEVLFSQKEITDPLKQELETFPSMSETPLNEFEGFSNIENDIEAQIEASIEDQLPSEFSSETITESLEEFRSRLSVLEQHGIDLSNNIEETISPEFPDLTDVAEKENNIEVEPDRSFIFESNIHDMVESDNTIDESGIMAHLEATGSLEQSPEQKQFIPQQVPSNIQEPNLAISPNSENKNPMHLGLSNNMGAPDTNRGNNISVADPEFQALVQWSNQEVDRAYHNTPEDMPNFLAQKRVEESKFSFKTVFMTIGICAVVSAMFYIGYEFGRVGNLNVRDKIYDATADSGNGIVVENNQQAASDLFSNPNTNQGKQSPSFTDNSRSQQAVIQTFAVNDINGTSGNSIPMNIKLSGINLGVETILLLRGIPDQLSLSTGLKREGVWSVPISDLGDLKLVAPRNYQGKFNVEVFAFKDKEANAERRVASVNIAPAIEVKQQPISTLAQADFSKTDTTKSQVRLNATPNQVVVTKSKTLESSSQQASSEIRVASRTPEKQAPSQVGSPIGTDVNKIEQNKNIYQQKPKPAPKISQKYELTMLRRGNQLLKNGDISAARLLFEHLAGKGSKHGAFALARTYDEKFLSEIFIRGLTPEIDKAIKWYREAATLGHKDAQKRLSQLNN